ncbi:MAG: hypothetical protein ABIS27_11415, partial [Longimicrobiales bacterium]
MTHTSPFPRTPRPALPSVVLVLLLSIAACDDLRRSQPVENKEVLNHIDTQLGGASTPIDTSMSAALSSSFRAAAAKALPAVVQITVTQRTMRTNPGIQFQGMQ